jgi:very-short-patch-repair endonuclease
VGYSRETAALLSVRDGAALSHQTAAMLWDLRTADVSEADPVDVMVGADWTGRRTGVRIHRTRTLLPRDVTLRHGLPVTRPARLLLDLATEISDRRLELALDELLVARQVRLADITELLTRVAHHRGRRRLARLLEHHRGPMLTRSEAEERLLALIRAAELPEPEVNAQLGGYEVDFLWRTQRFALEVDGFRFHSGRGAFERDRRKDQRLRALGVDAMRTTWRQLEEEPYALIARIAAALALAGKAAA